MNRPQESLAFWNFPNQTAHRFPRCGGRGGDGGGDASGQAGIWSAPRSANGRTKKAWIVGHVCCPEGTGHGAEGSRARNCGLFQMRTLVPTVPRVQKE